MGTTQSVDERGSRRGVLRTVRPGPRARMAARLYASGAVKSKRAACEAVGLHPAYLSMLDSAGNETTTRIENDVDKTIADETIALSAVIARLSRRALSRVNQLMASQNEPVALKAATDLLDRNPETSKTFKASVTTFSMGSEDAKELAAALIAGARAKEKYLPVAAGDFVKIEGGEDSNGAEKERSSRGPAEHSGPREADAPEAGAPGGPQGPSAQGAPQERGVLTHGQEEA